MRRCQRLGCENSLEHLRVDARYCSPTCKREAQRSRRLSDGAASGGFWPQYTLIRRRRRRTTAHAAILALLSILLLAGCGGHKLSAPEKIQRATHHTCDKRNEVMQCILPPPPVGLRLGGSAFRRGIDFGWSCPTPPPGGFGASYLSYDTSKNWTRSCVNRYHAVGAATVAVWETGANRAQQGYNAGFTDAKNAALQLSRLGAPAGQSFTMAVDCDCAGSTLVGYFRGARAAEGSRVNAYGGYFQVLYLFQRGLVGHSNWQTYAWSGGRWLPASIAPLEQVLNGTSVDYDRAIAPNFAQWPYAHPKPRPRPSRAQIARWTRARDSSRRAYAARGCPTLAQRERWFGHRLHGRNAGKHRRALRASRRAYRQRSCAKFDQRARFFDRKLHR